jgi:hypothetical protein
MFMIAFIYDEMLKDKNMAKESYKKFLDKYPKDEDPNEKMSESAKMMLQMLDENRSIEDIIKNTPQTKDTTKTEMKDMKEMDKKETPVDQNVQQNVNPNSDGTNPNGDAPVHPKLKNK